jgi:hypothetical protein
VTVCYHQSADHAADSHKLRRGHEGSSEQRIFTLYPVLSSPRVLDPRLAARQKVGRRSEELDSNKLSESAVFAEVLHRLDYYDDELSTEHL